MEQSVADARRGASFIPEPTPAGMGHPSFMAQSPSSFVQHQAAGNELSNDDVDYTMADNFPTGPDYHPYGNGPATDFMG
jgi:hypothetical protein